MQAILLHWFAAQRIGLFYVKFSAEFNELGPEILEYLFWKMQENSMETSVVVYIDLILLYVLVQFGQMVECSYKELSGSGFESSCGFNFS